MIQGEKADGGARVWTLLSVCFHLISQRNTMKKVIIRKREYWSHEKSNYVRNI